MQIKALAQQGLNFLQKNSPYILTGLGCAGVVSTAVMTGKAACKAQIDIMCHDDQMTDELSQEELIARGNPHGYESTWKERFMLTWKYFIPPVVMGASSVACIIGAQTVNTRRHAALASLYTLTDQTLKDYQEKVKEKLGERKEAKIHEEMAQDVLDSHPIIEENIIRTYQGDMLCFDVYSGRYFYHDIEKLRRIQNDFNHELMGVMWMPLNDLYYLMGLEDVKLGEDIGWTVDELLEFKFESKLTSDKRPCLVVDYDVTPRWVKGNMWGGM